MSSEIETTAAAQWTPRRRLIAGICLIAVHTVAVAVLVATALLSRAAGAVPAQPFVTPSEMRSGALLLESEHGRHVAAPLVGTDVDIVVSGPTARARVTQIFFNPTGGWVEAVYASRLVQVAPAGGATLPKTATDAELRLWLGLAIAAAGPVLLIVRRRVRDRTAVS